MVRTDSVWLPVSYFQSYTKTRTPTPTTETRRAEKLARKVQPMSRQPVRARSLGLVVMLGVYMNCES